MDNLYLILLTCFIGLVLLLATFFIKSLKKTQRSIKGNKIYLLGPKGCGKTRFFLKLTLPSSEYNEKIPTVTSIQPTEFALDNNSTLVDTPGNKRSRPGIDELKEAKNFVIWINDDSLINDIEYLLRLFNKSMKDEIPVTVVSNIPKSKILDALEECVGRIYKTESEHTFCDFNLDDCKIMQSIEEIDNIKAF